MMEPVKQAPRQVAQMVSRCFMVLAVTAMAGAFLAQSVDAKEIPANGVSIAKRVGYQKDFCDAGGGLFDSVTTGTGDVITTCSGGNGGGGTCVNTEQSTNCGPALTRPPEEVNTPPTGGVYEEPVQGGIQTGNVTSGAGGGGQLARAAADAQSDDRAAKKDKSKKQKANKGKKAGGKRKGGRGGR
jgi:hypothetical protein